MKVIQETVDDELFIDLILEPREIDDLHEQSIEPSRIEINGIAINLWVRTATQRELYDYDDWE